ncbi:TatD family hydrolase [Candidatus Daviesbacteria bacterium]|nr:TatD family hydrolase [Candidatus Daviesbacteria bacterium]
MNLVDTHAHLYWESYKPDFDEVIKRAVEARISTIVNIGVDIETSQKALDQIQNTKWPESLTVYSSIGIHPHEAITYSDDPDSLIQKDMDKLEQIYNSNPEKVVGIGECGLDFLFHANDLHPDANLSPEKTKELQKKLFQAQIDLAKKLDLPLIVHCRDDRSENPQNSECWNEVLEMVEDYQTILHCYSGLGPTTEKVLKNPNLTVSLAANITYPKNEYLREAAKILPLERILLETDSPFLAPQSKRGQRNEPSAVLEIAQLIADLKGISLEAVANQTTQNALTIFSLPLSKQF